MEGKKPPEKVQDVDMFEEQDPNRKKAMDLMTQMTHDWNVMTYGVDEAKKMAANGTAESGLKGIAKPKDNSMTDALVASAAQDYVSSVGMTLVLTTVVHRGKQQG